MALVLGTQVYGGVGFVNVQEPDDDHESSGWRMVTDAQHTAVDNCVRDLVNV